MERQLGADRSGPLVRGRKRDVERASARCLRREKAVADGRVRVAAAERASGTALGSGAGWSWAAGLSGGRRSGRIGPRAWAACGVREGVGRRGEGVRAGPKGLGWVGFPVFFLFCFSNHSNLFEFKLLCTQTKKTYASA